VVKVKGTQVNLNAPEITAPTNGSTVAKGDLTVSWKAVSGATGYQISVRDLSTNTLLKINGQDINGYGLSGTSFVIPGDQLVAGHQVRIAVSAVAAGVTSKYSQNVVKVKITPLSFTNTLKYGDKSDEVSQLQNRFTDLGLDVGSDGTGYFGRKTLAAVVAFQISRA
jgi:hypothetical protein